MFKLQSCAFFSFGLRLFLSEVTNKAVEWAVLLPLTRILKLRIRISAWKPTVLTEDFCCFLQSLKENGGALTQIRPQMLPSLSFQNHYPFTIILSTPFNLYYGKFL
jgi:hypothetical protein